MRPELESDTFISAFRQAILELAALRPADGPQLELADVASVIRVPKGKIHTWLGMGMSRDRVVPLRPRLHQVPGVARLFILARGAEDDDEWEAEIDHICDLLGRERLHPAGVLIVRKLWEQGLSVPDLRKTTKYSDSRRLLYSGFATAPRRSRLAHMLALSEDEVRELQTRSRARDKDRMRRKRRLHKKVQKAADEAAAKRTHRAHERYAKSWEALEAEGPASVTKMVDLGYKRKSVRDWRRLVDTATVTRQGGDPP
jgi:hypothetical protein